MTIEKVLDGKTLNVAIDGRLDTNTAPQLEAELKEALDQVDTLVMDFAKLAYISSAGLRVLLATQKIMNKQGSMTIKNVSEEVMEVFDLTGFVDILNIE